MWECLSCKELKDNQPTGTDVVMSYFVGLLISFQTGSKKLIIFHLMRSPTDAAPAPARCTSRTSAFA